MYIPTEMIVYAFTCGCVVGFGMSWLYTQIEKYALKIKQLRQESIR